MGHRFNKKSKTIDIGEVKIPSIYLAHKPNKEKVHRKEEEFLRTKILHPVTLDKENNLTDGFINLLIAYNHKIKNIPYITKGDTVHGLNIFSDIFFNAYYNDSKLARQLIKEALKNNEDLHNKRERMYHRQDGKCYLCGRSMDLIIRNGVLKANTATIDHKIPLALMGSNTEDNLALCCHRCNLLKGTLMYVPELKDIIRKQRDYEDKLRIKAE